MGKDSVKRHYLCITKNKSKEGHKKYKCIKDDEGIPHFQKNRENVVR